MGLAVATLAVSSVVLLIAFARQCIRNTELEIEVRDLRLENSSYKRQVAVADAYRKIMVAKCDKVREALFDGPGYQPTIRNV